MGEPELQPLVPLRLRDPFTNTGGLATYPITDKLSVTGGLVLGWDNVADNNNSPSFMGTSRTSRAT
jgi:hypothetical protein